MLEDQTTYPFWIDPVPGGAGTERLGLSQAFVETLKAQPLGLDLPKPPIRLAAGESLALLHTATGSIDLRAPWPLEVMEINKQLIHDARLLALSPYQRGWIAVIRRQSAP